MSLLLIIINNGGVGKGAGGPEEAGWHFWKHDLAVLSSDTRAVILRDTPICELMVRGSHLDRALLSQNMVPTGCAGTSAPGRGDRPSWALGYLSLIDAAERWSGSQQEATRMAASCMWRGSG